MNVLFFEDDYNTDSNIKFRLELMEEVNDISLDYAGNLEYFEKHLRNKTYDVFILDIMSTETNIISGITLKRVERSFVGIEFAFRIRAGYYKNQKEDAIIIIRSARATEPDIRRLCKDKRIHHICSPGSDDHKIIKILQNNQW